MLTQGSSALRLPLYGPPHGGFFCLGGIMPENNIILTVNGKSHPHTEGMTVASLLAELPDAPATVVVEVNGVIIPKESFAETALHGGDRLEVVHFVGGG